MLPRGIALRIRPAAGAILCSMFAAVALCGCSRRASIKTPSGIVLRSQSVSLPAHGREFAGGPEAGEVLVQDRTAVEVTAVMGDRTAAGRRLGRGRGGGLGDGGLGCGHGFSPPVTAGMT